MAEFRMPHLGADMQTGTLVEWRKRPGDAVRRGEIIADVESDKGVIEAEALTSGVVEELLVQPGTEVPVGAVLAIIRVEGEAPGAGPPPPHSLPERVAVKAEAPLAGVPAPPPPGPPAAAPRITPLARKLAAELGVDIAIVTGTGPGGRIQQRDIEEAAALPDRRTGMRRAIAAAMERSNREIPHFYLATTIDLSRALAWLAAENERRPVADRLLSGLLLLKAVSLALREVPELNAIWEDGKIVARTEVHVGVAVSLRDGGLVVPALHDTDRQSMEELMRNFRDLIQRARTGSLRSSEVSDATITVTSLGEQGVEAVFGLIYPPQVALVGFGKVVERPWSVDGEIVSRPLVTATLAADHRIIDGHRASLFLAAVDRLLQEPNEL